MPEVRIDANGAFLNQDMVRRAVALIPKNVKRKISFCIMSVKNLESLEYGKYRIVSRWEMIKQYLRGESVNIPIRPEFGYPEDRVTFRNKTGEIIAAIVNLGEHHASA